MRSISSSADSGATQQRRRVEPRVVRGPEMHRGPDVQDPLEHEPLVQHLALLECAFRHGDSLDDDRSPGTPGSVQSGVVAGASSRSAKRSTSGSNPVSSK